MPVCSRTDRVLILGAVMLLTACGQRSGSGADPHELRVASAFLDDSQPQQVLKLDLQHQFSPELVDALHNGVALTYAWQLELMDADGSPWQGRRWLDTGSLRLSYRSFTQWYTISQQPAARNRDFPDLEQLRAALQSLSMPVHIPPELMAPDSPFRFRFRIHLDINQLPPPLRLPAYMSATWRLDSGWHEWWPPPVG